MLRSHRRERPRSIVGPDICCLPLFASATIQFIVGKEFRRSDLHDQYGGSRQGGISPSAKSPLVLLFTGESGKQYGYLHDGFREDGAFWYTGEGRNGDMRVIKGNSAIRDSAAKGNQLHLFEQTRKGFVQYLGLGKFSYLDRHEERTHQTQLETFER